MKIAVAGLGYVGLSLSVLLRSAMRFGRLISTQRVWRSCALAAHRLKMRISRRFWQTSPCR